MFSFWCSVTRTVWKFLFIAALLLAGSNGFDRWALIHPVQAAENIQVNEVRIGEHKEFTRFVVDMNQNVPYQIFTLGGPYRVVIDLPELKWAQKKGRSSGLVAGFRYGLFRPGVSRIVIDTKGAVGIRKHFRIAPKGSAGHRLVIDLVRIKDSEFKKASRKISSEDWAGYLAKHQPTTQPSSTPATGSRQTKASHRIGSGAWWP